jgi:hypothetical protein
MRDAQRHRSRQYHGGHRRDISLHLPGQLSTLISGLGLFYPITGLANVLG